MAEGIDNGQVQTAPTQDTNTRLQASAWGEPQTAAPQAAPTDVQQAAAQTEPTEEIFDEDVYIKNKFGYDNYDAFNTEINTWKANANKPSWEWKNDDSKRIAEALNEGKTDELYDYFSRQRQVEKLSKADLSNDKSAVAELIKFGIKQDNANANLTSDEIDFVFNQKYALPDKPVQDELETPDMYEARVNAWQNHINNIQRQMVIDAKMQQPKLAQFKSELVFPQIQQATPNQPTEDDIKGYKERESAFIKSAQSSLENFKGVSYNVKDKDVDYTVNYAPSEEGMNFIAGQVQNFINSNMDANSLFAQRWVNKDNTINTDQMIRDLSMVFEGEKIVEKMATDSGNKRIESYLKGKKNVDVTGGQPQGTFNPQNAQTKMDRIREQAFA